MPEPEPSSGWQLLSDQGLLDMWEHYRPLYKANKIAKYPSGFTSELARRGQRIAQCPKCGLHRILKLHDYVCTICRRTHGLEER